MKLATPYPSMGARGREAWIAMARAGARDAVGGLVGAVVLVANIVSFGALMFPGELAGGIPIAIWAMLVGSALGGLWIAWATSLPPIATGIDSPTGAVLVLLSASASTAITASGGSLESAVVTVMLLFTAATLMSGAMLYLIGFLPGGLTSASSPISSSAAFSRRRVGSWWPGPCA